MQSEPAMSRELIGKIVDEVFDGAIEDASVIEEIYAAIKRHESALSTDAEAVKTAPAVAVTDGLREAIEKLLDQAEHVCLGAHTPLDIKGSAKNLAEPIKNLHAALSAQVQDVAGLLDETWNTAVERAAAIADDCVHLTPDPGAAIRTMLNGRTTLPASPASKHGDAE